MSQLDLRSYYILVSILVASAAFAQDEPDLKREERFFNTYSHFNQEPTSEESWAGATNGKAQSYTVQGGDTLWGLSETLFADPNYWPKIWSLNNEEIQNPHEILPQQEVKFFAGTMGEAPTMAVTDGSTQQEAVVEASVEIESAKKDPVLGVELPEPKKKYVPVSGLPSSIPKWDYRKDKRQQVQMEVEKINRDFGTPDEVLTYMIADKEIASSGVVAETELGMGSAGEYQYVFVKLPNATSEKKMLVVRNIGKVEDETLDKEGVVVQVQGEIEILEAVNAEEFLYRALVKRIFHQVEVGSQLMPGDLATYNANDDGAGGTANARLVGGQFNAKRMVFGPSNLVFLSGQGLTLGQSYPIYKVQNVRVEKSEGYQNPRVIGRVKVVNVSQNFATAVVLSATDDLRVGDVTDPSLTRKK